MSDFYWLIKTPPTPSIAPAARSAVSRLNGPRGPGKQLAQYRAPSVLLAFLKRWGPLSELRHHWFACTGTSDEQTHPGREPRPSAHSVNPTCPAWSRISPWTCQAWVALPHNPKDHRNTQAVGTQSAGQRTGWVWVLTKVSMSLILSSVLPRAGGVFSCEGQIKMRLWRRLQVTFYVKLERRKMGTKDDH